MGKFDSGWNGPRTHFGDRRKGGVGPWIGWMLSLGLIGAWTTWPSALPTRIEPPVAQDELTGSFALCHRGGGYDCVVDGDTFWFEGQKIRIADIDTPETHPSRCTYEAELGERATLRLRELLNQGPFALAPIDRDLDRYGRALRIVMRDGRSLGGQLVAEGLARPYAGGHREGWCA